MRRSLLLAWLVALSACAGSPKPAPKAATTETRQPAPKGSAGSLPFVEDDYARALTDARTRHVPLFVDAWAPWCHSCMSLRSFVFVDPRVTARAGDFAWLSIDTEKAENAGFVQRFPLDALPTLFVIDPDHETALVKWPGTLTAPELVDLLDDAKTKETQQGDASGLLLRGDRSAARGATDEAISEYRAALAAASATWSRRGRLVDSLVTQLEAKKDYVACARLAVAEGPKLPPGTARVDVAVAGATCALGPEDAGAAREVDAYVPALLAELRTLTSDRTLPLVADDRSGAFEALVDLLHAEPRGPKTLRPQRELAEAAEAWASFLEQEARTAPNAAARAVFDPHRLLAYVELHEPARAIPMLEQTAKDFPSDYNPHARLARAYLELRRYDDAVAEADKALALAYGPRKLRIYVQKADILKAKGDTTAEKAALREALAFAATVPLREGYVHLRDEIEARSRR